MKVFRTVKEIHPELIQLWEQAWELQPSESNPWIIPLTSRQQAVSMRQRMYTARRKMLDESYLNSTAFNKMEIKLVGNNVCIYIPDWVKSSQEALKAAGVELKHEVKPEEPAEEEGSMVLTEATLKELFPSQPQVKS